MNLVCVHIQLLFNGLWCTDAGVPITLLLVFSMLIVSMKKFIFNFVIGKVAQGYFYSYSSSCF